MHALIRRLTALGHRARTDERGASLVEYALLVALIAVVCIASVTFLGTSNSGQIDHGGSAIDNGDSSTTLPTSDSTDQGTYVICSSPGN